MAWPPKDPYRWWLRPGEVAARVQVNGKPADLVFDYDDGSLWGFELAGTQPIYNHMIGSLAFGVNEDDNDLRTSLYEAMRSLTGGREGWPMPPQQQAVLDIMAADLSTKPIISGKRLRRQLLKQHAMNETSVAYQLEKLIPRYVVQRNPKPDDLYALTLPGLLRSSQEGNTKTIILWTLSALALAFDKHEDMTSFTTEEVMRAPGFTKEDTDLWTNVMVIARLGRNPTPIAKGYQLMISEDVEKLSLCKDLPSFWSATIDGGEAGRPWPTAPLRPDHEQELAKYIAEQDADPSLNEIRRSGLPVREAIPEQPATATREETNMKYDVAFSFAGEDRPYAEELKKLVVTAGFKVFYDNDEEAELWGKNLVDYLADVYANQARYVVFFISEHYVKKEWTTHERQAAQATALKKKGKEYILPIRIDATEVPGLFASIGYVSITKGIPHIAETLIKKLRLP